MNIRHLKNVREAEQEFRKVEQAAGEDLKLDPRAPTLPPASSLYHSRRSSKRMSSRRGYGTKSSSCLSSSYIKEENNHCGSRER